ncbi:MAG: Taurine-binding periplasmic protein [Chroococcidiopsis cubana SAG 39.79]|uniref:Solute-binding protein family 3/N-terminal domain-containing protein n=1 Tax=Chroococcidiopsis cubana SAG 39.79 TaxID=388085 RepID=A0AB37UF18_9CYAN|nr:ABC transporter substrate-binding protein [Chroococcidiopsis cubana]MDZ4872211.1 Taurine-binding periplasmic protein [Chroococcidiopsis cubana SAG 39.79]PSB63946.1 aliphatic sulfonate ABC transporter substrate-binding protein [Chroococcidiopsis cubana CCALA 043]RUT07981.1 hypothetical protein DSM107010_49310 [Chroococcidiopsis cubana SAG 39.79]
MDLTNLSRRRLLKHFSLSVGVLLLTVGCNEAAKDARQVQSNSESEGQNSTETASAAPTSQRKIKVGYQTGDINNVTMVAFNEGYFKDAGLEVELLPFSSGADMIPALGGGQVDVTWFFPFPALSAFARGIAIEVFLIDHAPRTAERLLARNVDNTAALKGKKIGVTFGSTGHYFTLQALKKVGLTEQDITLVNLKPAGMVPAYSANQIDAVWTWEPAVGELLNLGATTLETVESVDGYTAAIWAIRKAYAEQNPDTIQAFIKAWDLAQQNYLKNPQNEQRWEAKRLNLSKTEFSEMVKRQGTQVIPVKEQISTDWLGTPGEAKATKFYSAFERYGKFLESLGRIQKAPSDYSSLINSSYVQEYIDSTLKV